MLELLNSKIIIKKNSDLQYINESLYNKIYNEEIDKNIIDDMLEHIEYQSVSDNENEYKDKDKDKDKDKEETEDVKEMWDYDKYIRLIRFFKIPVIEDFYVNEITSNSTIEELEWYLRSGLFMKYDETVIDMCNDIQVLNWWLEKSETRQLRFKYSEYAMFNACSNNNLELMNWWYDNMKIRGMIFMYGNECMDYATSIDVLDWWVQKNREDGIKLKYTKEGFEYAKVIMKTDKTIYNWWIASGLAIEKI
jgi:hypothetical protein